MPVVWGSAKNLKIMSEYFKRNDFGMVNITEPFAYLTDIENGYYKHHFRRVNTLIFP